MISFNNSHLDINSNLHVLELSEVFKGQVWRLLTSHLVFNNMGQAFFGLIALYNLRQFERQLGAKKFAAFLVISYIISLFSQILVLFLVNTVGGQHFVFDNGPYFLIFALLSLFYCKRLIIYNKIYLPQIIIV